MEKDHGVEASPAPEEPAPDAVAGYVPQRLAGLVGLPQMAAVWGHQVTARAAEAQVLTGLLDYRQAVAAEVAGEHVFARQAADKSAVHDAAQMLGVADITAAGILNAAGFIREDLPQTWSVFTTGLIDFTRVRRIAVAAVMLPVDQPELVTTLDAEVSQVAAEITSAELKNWLARRVPELDTEAFAQRADEALARRYVRIEHHDDGTSYLEALLPTVEAAVIEKRLKRVAASMDIPQPADLQPVDPEPADDPGEDHHLPVSGAPVDGRTRAQRQADLLSAWLRTGCTYGAAVEAKICVLIPETTLTEASDQPGLSADRSWMLPADQARKLATDPLAEHHWYTGQSRSNPRQADHNILTVVYQGRFPPQRLRDSIIFRDGICQTPGCTVPAERCDLDHQQSYETGGPTTGTNLWALCRRHHQMKSHGYLPAPAS